MATSNRQTPSALAPIKQQQKQNAAVHIVRIKVLGLAGVVVDNTPNEKSPSLSPEHMKAAIVLSRDGRPVGNANNSNGWAASNLSLPLRPSPSEDVVTPRDDVSFSGDTKASMMSAVTKSSLRMQQKDAEKGAVEVAPPGSVRSAGRYLAVWDGAMMSRDRSTSGDKDEPVVLEFETPLARTESTSQAMSSAGAGDASIASVTTSRFAPKSFNIGIVLSPSVSGIDVGCAYPLGAASLTIIGDDAELGERVVDLPVLCTAATRPMVGPGSASKERKMVDLQNGRDIKSLKEMEQHLTGIFSAAASMSETNSSKVGKKKKSRSSLKKFWSKKSTASTMLVTPRSQLEAFPDKYSIDSSGDAVLRLSIEVRPKPEPNLANPSQAAAVPVIAAKRRGSGAKITVIPDAQEKAQNSEPAPSDSRPVVLNKRNPSDEFTETVATAHRRDDKVSVGASVLAGAPSKEEDAATFGSTSKSEPSLGMIESNETDLTRETGTVGTGTVGDGQTTIGTDVETAASFKMTSSFVNRFTYEVASMAREAQAEGEKTGNVFEAYFDTFILAGCRPVPKDDNDEKSDYPKSPAFGPGINDNSTPVFPRNSSNNSPRGVDDLPVKDGRDVDLKSPSVGEKITSLLTCGGGAPSESLANNGKPTRFVDRTPPPADQRPPREIVPDSDVGSIGDLTENTFDYYTKRIGATSRVRSTPYDSRNQDMYGMNGPDDMTMGKEDDPAPFSAAINTSMCNGICPYEEAKKFGQEI